MKGLDGVNGLGLHQATAVVSSRHGGGEAGRRSVAARSPSTPLALLQLSSRHDAATFGSTAPHSNAAPEV